MLCAAPSILNELHPLSRLVSTDMPTIDLSALTSDRRARRSIRASIRRGRLAAVRPGQWSALFDPTSSSSDDDQHAMVFTSHHLVCDGWSTNVLLDELSQLYAAESQRCRAPISRYRCLSAAMPYRRQVGEQLRAGSGRSVVGRAVCHPGLAASNCRPTGPAGSLKSYPGQHGSTNHLRRCDYQRDQAVWRQAWLHAVRHRARRLQDPAASPYRASQTSSSGFRRPVSRCSMGVTGGSLCQFSPVADVVGG